MHPAETSVACRLRLDPAAPSPERFDELAAGRLTELSRQDHFWLRERSRLIQRLLDQLLAERKDHWRHAIELGCGTGLTLSLLEARARQVSAVDGHPRLLQLANANSRSAILHQADVTDTRLPAHAHDLVVALDVIEHVDGDALLREARRLAQPGGILLLSAPAFPSLWSDMDERAGHRCRYRWAGLKAELVRNHWQPIGHTHFQCLLFPLIYVSRRWSGGGTRHTEFHPSARLDRWLGAINRFEVEHLGDRTLPFGSSVLAWARASNT